MNLMQLALLGEDGHGHSHGGGAQVSFTFFDKLSSYN